MKIINEELLNSVSQKAKISPRLRMNYNFHEELSDPINRLLNAMEPDTYIRPHRHLNPDKNEYFLLLRGKAILFIFDDKGNITEKQLLCPNEGTYGAEIEAGLWHNLVVLEPNTIIYEIKPGPFAPLSSDNFASWSPDPEDTKKVCLYIAELKNKI